MSNRVLAPLLPLAVILAGIADAQITVTQPSANTVFRAADDYATQAFQDPWDMKQWTDLGWYTYGVDQPPSNLTGFSFAGGMFSATSTSTNPNFWLLDTFTPNSVPIGKIGSLFPIDSTKYQRLLIRMNLSGAGLANPPVTVAQSAQVLWSNNTIDQPGGMSTSNAFFTYPGWWVYSVNLASLGAAVGAAWPSLPVDSLRFDPVSLPSPIDINVGWARLVHDDPTLYGTIAWTGSGPVDIFLDIDTNFANGYVGQIATNVAGNTYQFYTGGLPAGTYYVAIRPTGSSATPAYSPGSWTVNDIPTLVFTSPSPGGSSDDFATVQLNQPWNSSSLNEIEVSYNVTGLAITDINAQDEAGIPLPNTRVISGSTTGNYGDPEIYPFYWFGLGLDYRIDTSRYRILDLKWGSAEARDINNGSIGRMVWRVNGESVENVSNCIILKTLPNANVMQEVIADMKTMPLAPDGGSPSTTGWNDLLDGFRVKTDEFSVPINFYIESIRLNALEQANASYTVQWNYSNEGATVPTLELGWDNTGSGFAGTLIASGLNPATGSYVWNTSGLADGTYYIYARLMNGAPVMNQSYAKWPLVVNHAYPVLPTFSLDQTGVWFGATNNGVVVTGPQTVHVTAPAGVSWTVSSDRTFMVVSPTSGVGSGAFTIGIQDNALPSPASMDGTVTVTAAGASNSPQYVHMYLNVVNTGTAPVPFGSFDTPSNNATGLAGNVAVTGWALDTIGVQTLQIWRNPVSGETPTSNGLIYIGNATFVAGARPDVQALYPNYPQNSIGGWGYMMLTNGLPNNGGSSGTGNGTYTLHAIVTSIDGSTVDLGTKTITCNNAGATTPIGTIDTPGQGATVSGTIVNFGWALTQQPYTIPTDGSTIWVTVDGQYLGHPVYNNYRSDIAMDFPGYNNSNGAVGYYYLDTTTLSDGMHSIGWLVTDNAGRTNGVGSRFFWVLN
jgi:hypothetical protein